MTNYKIQDSRKGTMIGETILKNDAWVLALNYCRETHETAVITERNEFTDEFDFTVGCASFENGSVRLY